MSLLMMLALRGAQTKTQTFTASGNFIVPTTTTKMESLVGIGARGQASTTRYVRAYRMDITTYNYYSSAGQTIAVANGSSYGDGPVPANYCDSPVPTANGTTYNCYTFTDASYYDTNPATTGASSTAFGKNFPGSTGNVAPAVTTFTAVPVTSGQSYPITVPAGGYVTLTWLE
jgi:hypothetical protein